mgnify:CR=1 FL=1
MQQKHLRQLLMTTPLAERGVILVGSVNGDPFSPIMLGMLTVGSFDALAVMSPRGVRGRFSTDYDYATVQDVILTSGKESFVVPMALDGNGMRVYRRDGEWRFATHIYVTDKGLSGPLAYGGDLVLAFLHVASRAQPARA